jgi:uncharacterized protein (DUF362 family)
MKVFYASTRQGVAQAVNTMLDALGWEDILPAGEDLLLKVNLTWDFIRPGVNTSPWVVEAISRRLKKRSGTIYVGESSQVLVNATRAFAVTRMKDVAERNGLVWHNFSDNNWERVRLDGLDFGIPAICLRMPVISIPVVKTHYRSGISVALKNLFGCLDDNRHNYHYRLADYVTAVNRVIPVAFTIADGTVSLEGNGPKPGIPKQTDFIAGSLDRVALDYSIAGVMGLDPASVETTRRAEGKAGSFIDLEEVALPPMEKIPSFDFTTASPNFVARIEKRFRGARISDEPSSDGPLMGLLKMGAKRWYRLAYHLFGQGREARQWIADNRYGSQWAGMPEEPLE